MAKIEITKTELVWPGKYNEDGTRKEVPRVNLPFQIIETINESRATREAKKAPQNLSLFDIYEGREGDTFEEGWKNKLIWGDNLLVMGSLLERFAGKVDLIYIDPPFATGADFSFSTEVGESGEEITKDQSVIEEKAYRDTWGRGIDSYLSMIYDRLFLLQIPREVMEQQAAAKGDVHFFELAYLEAKVEKPKRLTAQVALKDFVIPNTELIPEDVRGKVKKWSDYIDYWAVDWDFQNDTFMQGWVAYRTRKERKLPLSSDPYVYDTPGKSTIMVKVVDIFGNDTSQCFDVEVR